MLAIVGIVRERGRSALGIGALEAHDRGRGAGAASLEAHDKGGGCQSRSSRRRGRGQRGCYCCCRSMRMRGKQGEDLLAVDACRVREGSKEGILGRSGTCARRGRDREIGG